MSKDHSQPINEADRQARAAFKAYAQWFQASNFVDGIHPPLSISLRTFQRITSGQRDVPPGLAREAAELIREDMALERNRDQLEGWAMALEIWAEDCERRKKPKRGEITGIWVDEFKGIDDA